MPGADMDGLTRDRVAFGQGLAVTGLQEVSAIAGIVNGGIYHPPTILKSATDSDGKPVALPVKEPRRIVSAETSANVRDLMRAVVDNSGQERGPPAGRLHHAAARRAPPSGARPPATRATSPPTSASPR